MAARAIRQKYTPAKVNVKPPYCGMGVKKTGKDAEGEKQKKS